MELIAVKNRKPAAEAECPHCESWLKHWEKYSGQQVSICGALDCRNAAEVAGHVEMISAPGSHFILPLCRECAKSTENLQAILPLVSADSC